MSWDLILFAKHLRGLGRGAFVRELVEVGLDGVDLPVREGFPVEPEGVERTLPEMVRELEGEGLIVPMVTGETRLKDPFGPGVEALLGAMAESGVPLLKIGYFTFEPFEQNYTAEVDRARRALEGWEEQASKFGVTICYHTHSGYNLGCTVGGLRALLEGRDPSRVAAYLDAGHLGVSGEQFPVACGFAGEYLRAVAVKSMIKTWGERNGQRRAVLEQAPLHEGFLDLPAIFESLRKAAFRGPISLHIEYEGSQEEMLAGGKRDALLLREIANRAMEV